jgi:hypothetical protein
MCAGLGCVPYLRLLLLPHRRLLRCRGDVEVVEGGGFGGV